MFTRLSHIAQQGQPGSPAADSRVGPELPSPLSAAWATVITVATPRGKYYNLNKGGFNLVLNNVGHACILLYVII